MKKKIGLAVLAALIISQFFRIDKTNPSSIEAHDFLEMHKAPNNISTLIKDACYDCHSNHTEYPWYTNVSPISFWIKGHIKGARQNLNFSEWESFATNKKIHKIEECIEVLEDKRMPAKSFVLMHPEAKLTDQNISDLVTWFKQLKVE